MPVIKYKRIYTSKLSLKTNVVVMWLQLSVLLIPRLQGKCAPVDIKINSLQKPTLLIVFIHNKWDIFSTCLIN
jgi:hypothetical protein